MTRIVNTGVDASAQMFDERAEQPSPDRTDPKRGIESDRSGEYQTVPSDSIRATREYVEPSVGACARNVKNCGTIFR